MSEFPSGAFDENGKTRNPVESKANFEGNDAEILFSRLANPHIKRQLAEIIFQQKFQRYNLLRNEEWEQYLPEGWTGEEPIKLLRGKRSGTIISRSALETELKDVHRPPSLVDIQAELDKTIEKLSSVTEIEFSSKEPRASVMTLDWIMPWTGKKPTSKQMSIIEAHEKGHRIRQFDHVTEKLKKGFDISRVQFTQDFFLLLKENAVSTIKDIDESEWTFEGMRKEYLNDYLFTGMEIAERMSQLKSYFGFKGSEKFTKEHLDYAREHYVEDTGMDNAMGMFFEAITSETEDAFLESINASGI